MWVRVWNCALVARISRSVVDFGALVERSRRGGWGLVFLDTDVDTTRVNGELVANIVISIAQWERRIIGERTREASEEKRRSGTRLSRPEGNGFEPILVDVIKKMRRMGSRGMSLTAIAKRLEATASLRLEAEGGELAPCNGLPGTLIPSVARTRGRG